MQRSASNEYSRREFLGTTARWMLATGIVAQLPWLSGCGGSGGGQVVPDAAWKDLAKRIKGTVLLPGSPRFDQVAQPNNLRYNSIRPAGIARCLDEDDVREAVLWSRDNGIDLVARSGGHSYAGFSTTEGLMIDLSPMDKVALDPNGRVVTGGGARNKHVFDSLATTGMAVTHGRCFGVGVGGLVLGGGIGFDMRKHGLTCDHLVQTTMVNAKGEVLTLSENENADLFWACRGAGGGNFGIHTSFVFEGYPVGDVVAFNITWVDGAEEALAALIPAMVAAPDEFGAKLSVIPARPGSGERPKVNLLGQHFGSENDLRDLLASVYAVAKPQTERVAPMPYWPAQTELSEVGGPEYYHERSRFVDQALSSQALGVVWDWISRWPGTSEGASFKLFQSGGQVNRKSPGATAFVHRNSLFIGSVALQWSREDSRELLRRNLDWLDGLYEAFIPFAGPGAYQNFVDPSLHDWQTAYYGANLPRLMEVKRRYDPNNVFHYPQSIPV
jgi:hypothetical protein